MHENSSRATLAVVTGLMLVCATPMSLAADAGTARLEGLVIGSEGRPTSGATVYLFDDDGTTRAKAVSADDGLYALRDLPAGRYGMSLRTPEGIVAPVASGPITIGHGELVRRDLKLVEADAATVDRALAANHSFGSWFGGLTTAEKAGVIVGFVAVAALIYSAFDDEGEQPASPME